MDVVTLGAALSGSKEQTKSYVKSHFKGGSNIQIVDNADGTQTINASGEVSAEDTVARETIAEHVSDKTNPHEVTKTQIGLGNVDNTSDINKPISTATQNALNDKVDKELGKGLSTNDFTTVEKTKLEGIAEGAEVNVQSNWTQTTTTADDYIKNKPTLGTAAAKNATDTYSATGTDVTTGKAVAAALATLPEPMVFKGSLGTGGTITTLPTASSSNKGCVYKVITTGTYASQFAKVGDTFISDGSAWVLIPSGDEPSGTVTNVAVVNGGGLAVSGSPITSSGTIIVGHSNSVTAKTSSSVKKFTYDEYGHITGSSELSTAESDALASGIDSAKVAQIETNKSNISKDEAALIELVDSGAKNLLKNTAPYGDNVRTNITFSHNSDDSYIINAENANTQNTDFYVATDVQIKPGTYKLSGCPAGGDNSSTYKLQIAGIGYDMGDGLTFTIVQATTINVYIRIWAGYVPNGLVFKPMICAKTAWDISQKYVPYRPPYQEIYEQVETNENNISSLTAELHALLPNITASTTIQDYANSLSKGVYTAFIANVSNPSDSPINANCFVNIYVYSATTAAVELIPIASNELLRTYSMRKIAGTWREWYMVEGTPVTSSTQS